MKICPKCSLKYGDEHERCFVDATTLVVAPDPYLGRTLGGRYLIEQKIGEGGMATVYRARHVLVDRPVAVKILSEQVASNPSMLERFRREAKNAAALTHPNIIEIYDHGETDEKAPYLVMELLVGHSLGDRIHAGRVPAPEAAGLGLQMANGLARAHDFGVIHRDLKPDNVFIASVGGRSVVKLLDFGIARSMHDPRLTSAGELFGTPQYMSPERLTSIDAGASSDLYAVGVMLFEMLTGRLPFVAETLPALFLAHLSETPPRPSTLVPNVPRRLEDLIMALLAKTPEQRPVDAHSVIRELATMAPAEMAAAPAPVAQSPRVAPTLPPTTLERWARRTSIFEEMLRRAHPEGAPPELARKLAEVRDGVGQIQMHRTEGLVLQRKLDAIETESRETRGRLGYAMQRIGEALSHAREAARQAESETAPYIGAATEAEAGFRGAAKRLAARGPLAELAEPTEEIASDLRAASEAIARWVLSYGTAASAREFVATRSAEVSDMEFQAQALRDQLARVEQDAEAARAKFETDLAARTREVEALQQALLSHGTALVEALRPRGELGDLFQRLETEGGG